MNIRTLFCKHKYKEINKTEFYSQHYEIGLKVYTGNLTRITQMCENCGKIREIIT